ncbi:response regulator [Elusimicrobiota bacterium]
MEERILVVDDEEGVVRVVEEALKKRNHSVITTLKSTEALELIKDKKNNIRMLITDIQMPDIDGLELAKFTREYDQSIKIIAISGSATLKGLTEEDKALFNCFLQKPFDLEELRSAVIQTSKGI